MREIERLTERFSNGQTAVYGCGNNCKYDFKYCENHLEDCPTINEIYEKLATYEDLEEQGRLIKLPCAVGDTVYYRHDGNKIEPMQVEEILIAKHTFLLTIAYSGSDEKLKYWRVRTDITAFDNKVIFLTREEAEDALKGLEG